MNKITLKIDRDDIGVFLILIVCIFFVGGLLGYILKIAMETF